MPAMQMPFHLVLSCLKLFVSKEVESIPDLFQDHVNMLLKENRDVIGDYYEIVAGLLTSDCSRRMTVTEAENRLARIAQPD